MSHHIPNWGQILTISLTLLSVMPVWALPSLPFRFPRVCLCTLEREANWKWAWTPDASGQSLSHLTNTRSCATHIHTHIHHLTQMFFFFFPSTPPFPLFFFSPTSPFQAKQNGCKHSVSAGGVECLRGLQQALALSDRPSCVWQLFGSHGPVVGARG